MASSPVLRCVDRIAAGAGRIGKAEGVCVLVDAVIHVGAAVAYRRLRGKRIGADVHGAVVDDILAAVVVAVRPRVMLKARLFRRNGVRADRARRNRGRCDMQRASLLTLSVNIAAVELAY